MKEKKILITGAHGFLGTHILKELRNKKYNNLFCPTRNQLDLTDVDQTIKYFNDHRFEIVIHLAAFVGGIGFNQKNPSALFSLNMRMGLNLFDACLSSQIFKSHKVEKIVNMGTVCAYPKFTAVPFKEEDIWNGYPEETNAPYGLAKKMLLVLGQANKQQYGINSIYLLPVNMYGPYDNFDPESSHVVPALIKKVYDAKKNKETKVECWGTGEATREFLYVEDAARGVVSAMENYNSSEPMNLGSGDEISIFNLVNKITKIMDYRGEIVWDKSKPDGQHRRCLDV